MPPTSTGTSRCWCGTSPLLAAALRSGMLGEQDVTRIVATARVAARLYALQLEELGNA
jgi:hypothetical protein